MHHVLVIEDEPSIADNIRYALKAGQFTVETAGNGQAGLAIFQTQSTDLIILDVGLPDMDGFDVCRTIRQTSMVPILFLTARDSEIDRVVGLELGADDYICKPFSPRELVARVKANLRRVESSAPTPMTESTLLLDLQQRTVVYRGQPITTTRYEFGILALLNRQPGRVYTREEILQHVWQEPMDSFDRVVDTHVKSIRAKFRAVYPDLDLIKTHRGVGYSLNRSP